MARVIALSSLVLLLNFAAFSSSHKEQKISEHYTVNEQHALNKEQLPDQHSHTENSNVLKNGLPEYLDLSKLMENAKLQVPNRDTVLVPQIKNREINIQANHNKFASLTAANNAQILRDSATNINIQNARTNMEKTHNVKQNLPHIQTQNYETIDKIKNQANSLQNIKQLVANVQKEVVNIGERDIDTKIDLNHQNNESQVTSTKIISPNNGDIGRQVVFVKPQIPSSEIIIENNDAHPCTGNRLIAQAEPNNEVLITNFASTKVQDKNKDRKIPIFEVIHDDTPKPAYHASVSVLPTRLSNGGSWSNKSLHNVIKKSITKAVDSCKITLSSNDVEVITDKVTLAVSKSLGLTPSGTRGTGTEEVDDGPKPSKKTMTDPTSPVLFPVSNEDTKEDHTLEEMQEVQKLYEDGSEGIPLSQSNPNAKTMANKNNQNLVRKENHYQREIIEKEKQIQKDKVEKENQEEEEEDGNDEEEEEEDDELKENEKMLD